MRGRSKEGVVLELLTGASSTIFKQLWSSSAPGGDDDDVWYGENDDIADNDNDDDGGHGDDDDDDDDGVNTGAMCITNDPQTAVQ